MQAANTTAGVGLTTAEARRRLLEFGVNEPVAARRVTGVAQLVRLFLNPLVLILLVASALSLSLGQAADSLIIITIVVLGTAINFWQTHRSQQAADRLRASVAPTATVLRDGVWGELARREVVPGDLVRLSAGDLVPADARLVESRDLSVQQSALTGESLPVDKAVTPDPAGSATPDAPGRVFLGTSVVSGTATALVTATGPRTMFGDIAARLASRPPETEFERGLRRFSYLILRTAVVLVLFILVVSVVLKRDPFESLLFAVALGVGLTPEFLPMIASVTLTQGAIRMAREGVIVKLLPAIQNLGSMDILCTDKTGTLTSGRMRLDAHCDPTGAASDRPLVLATLNSRFQTGIRSPLDTAVLDCGVDPGGYDKVDELPFDFERRRLSVVVRSRTAPHALVLVTKGAPESVLERVTSAEAQGRVTPLDALARAAQLSTYERLSAEGYRVLAIAYRHVDDRPAYSKDDETGLTLAGFLSFADPVLEDAAETIADLRRDGVTVKILTGDNALVTRHVCAQVGLGDADVVTGDEVARADDMALGHMAEEASVFARVSPAQKNRILLALKRRGHVVGYLGDGINDAPSLHTADVGVSVMSATDVARDAADIILGQPRLDVLHRGILAGRRASGNLMKYLLMGTSSNFGNVFSMAIATAFLPFLPMLPTQILLNNLLYDLAQVTIPSDRVDEAYLGRPRRWDIGLIRDVMIFIGPISSVFDLLTFAVLLKVFHAGESAFHTGWFIESLATQTLVLFVIRTFDRPWRSRPSPALAATTLAVVAIGIGLPWTPLARVLGFTPLPGAYFAFLAGAVVAYLALVEWVKGGLRSKHLN